MSDARCQYLLERCLRLEAQLADVALPVVPAPITPPPRTQQPVTAAEIATMRQLRTQGLPYAAIAARIQRGTSTIALYAGDVVPS